MLRFISLILGLLPSFLVNAQDVKFPKSVREHTEKLVWIPADTVVLQGTTHYIPYKSSDSLLVVHQVKRNLVFSDLYVSAIETSNNEYRQFINYVKDSIARVILGYKNDKGGLDYTREINPLDSQLVGTYYFPWSERFYKRREFNSELCVYAFNGNSLHVYPDTSCWLTDFPFSYNEPMRNMYFWHPAYDEYPVVGITKEQAEAYCRWKTKEVNKLLAKKGVDYKLKYRLPTEEEWMYVAGKTMLSREDSLLMLIPESYPLGEYLMKVDYGWLYNFGQLRDEYLMPMKDFKDDAGFHTVKTGAYLANDKGLFNIGGNVGEWVQYSTRGEVPEREEEIRAMGDVNVAKGGSWAQPPVYMLIGAKQFWPANRGSSMIGFRTVVEVEKK